ncbi:hypothetical protein H5410_027076 [Solanum commersonii]|uniref:Uncharacterized protein n=1 Tax=Solanum commersonii TaxID=4109 RepID=A0A9J5Z0R5_SOLCO|nr:hypothetical protein H5410_027076 [Solanum commersonii]
MLYLKLDFVTFGEKLEVTDDSRWLAKSLLDCSLSTPFLDFLLPTCQIFLSIFSQSFRQSRSSSQKQFGDSLTSSARKKPIAKLKPVDYVVIRECTMRLEANCIHKIKTTILENMKKWLAPLISDNTPKWLEFGATIEKRRPKCGSEVKLGDDHRKENAHASQNDVEVIPISSTDIQRIEAEYLKDQAEKKKAALVDSFPDVDTNYLPAEASLPTPAPWLSGTSSVVPSVIPSSYVIALPPRPTVDVSRTPLTQAALL